MKSYRVHGETPMSDWGHAMFTDNLDSVIDCYVGEYVYSVDSENLVGIDDMMETIVEKMSECYENGMLPVCMESNIDNGTEIEELANLFNPSDIVMSAEAWDDDEMTMWFWANIAEPSEIYGFKTNDGAIVFDENMIERIGTIEEIA